MPPWIWAIGLLSVCVLPILSGIRSFQARKLYLINLVALHRKARMFTDHYIVNARFWPESEPIKSPFSVRWRPSIGDAEVGADKQRVIEWEGNFRDFIQDLEAFSASYKLNSEFRTLAVVQTMKGRQFTNSVFEVIEMLRQLEWMLLTEIDRQLPHGS